MGFRTLSSLNQKLSSLSSLLSIEYQDFSSGKENLISAKLDTLSISRHGYVLCLSSHLMIIKQGNKSTNQPILTLKD